MSEPYKPIHFPSTVAIPIGWRLLTGVEIDAMHRLAIRIPYVVKCYRQDRYEWISLAVQAGVRRDGFAYIREIPVDELTKAFKKHFHNKPVKFKEHPIITKARKLKMTKDYSLADKILIMQAAELGAQIQFTYFTYSSADELSFEDIALSEICWEFGTYIYRIKPLPSIKEALITYTDPAGVSHSKIIKHQGDFKAH